MLSLTLFFESVCFPTIVALGIRGIGRHTKRGSGLIVAGVSGGAVVPPILGASVSRSFPQSSPRIIEESELELKDMIKTKGRRQRNSKRNGGPRVLHDRSVVVCALRELRALVPQSSRSDRGWDDEHPR